jgi:hypothetical protein
MSLPFSSDAFFDVFGQYNRALWPGVVTLWVAAALGLAAVALAGPDWRVDLAATVLLVALWSWSGAVYHAGFFTAINPAAWIFAAGFLAEAGLLAWFGTVRRRQLSFGSASSSARIGGIGLALYALAYPALSVGFGHPYPTTPTFGVPCPTTIFTVALLLTCERPPLIIAFVPLAWSVVGGSASLVLGVHADYVLLACAPLLASKIVLGGSRTPVMGRTL